MIDVLRRNLADLVHLFLVPLLIALLPWRLGLACLRRMARGGHGLDAVADAAFSAAREHVDIGDEAAWKWRFRLLQLLERVDTWLLLLRPARWWRHQVEVLGEWPPEARASVLLTYHWGGGQWVFRLLREHGRAAHFIAQRSSVGDHGRGRVSLGLAAVRRRALARAGCLGVLYVGDGSGRRIGEALARGESVCGMLDLPARDDQGSFDGHLLGQPVRLPNGLLRIGAGAGVPVLLFSASFDPASGRRRLQVEALPAGSDVAAIGARYLHHLDQCLRTESAFWQLWSVAPRLFRGERTADRPPA